MCPVILHKNNSGSYPSLKEKITWECMVVKLKTMMIRMLLACRVGAGRGKYVLKGNVKRSDTACQDVKLEQAARE